MRFARAWIAVGLLAACATQEARPAAVVTDSEAAAASSASEVPDALEFAPALEFPDGWDTQAPWDFEQSIERLTVGMWGDPERERLRADLRLPGQTSIRAAVLLAHGGLDSALVLIEHLERRQPEPERHGDAAEIVAASSLGRFRDPQVRSRLAQLAVGPDPHPDLEIRVECACVALDLGEREVAPFLLRVLHAGTPAELEDPIDWSPQDTLAWSKGRAAAALSRAAGLPNRFQADGPWAAQVSEARALAQALGIPG